MMEEKLRQVFSESLSLPLAEVVDSLRYSEAAAWDSVAHMALVASIEDAFDIMLDAEDVIDMSSFAKAKEIVLKYL
jgi:acyl carrier protein